MDRKRRVERGEVVRKKICASLESQVALPDADSINPKPDQTTVADSQPSTPSCHRHRRVLRSNWPSLPTRRHSKEKKTKKKSKIQGGKARKRKESPSGHTRQVTQEKREKKGEAAIFCVDVRMSKVNVDERHQTPSVPHRATILRCLRPLDLSYCRRCLLASTLLSFYRLSFVLKVDNRPARTMKTRWCCCVD